MIKIELTFGKCMKKTCFIVILFFSNALFGNVLHPLINDPQKHEANKKIISVIIEQELEPVSTKTASEKASFLSERITKIAKEALKKGFSTDAYSLPKLDPNSTVSFDFFVLWEGEKNPGSIPLTFLVYVWPSEKFSTQYIPVDYYKSIIHCHPIPCALAVLQGTLVQKNYKLVSKNDKVVRLIDETTFQEGEGEVDDLRKSFIHQVYNPGPNAKTLSLHAYGLSSEEKVMKCFEKTSSQCCFEEIQSNNR